MRLPQAIFVSLCSLALPLLAQEQTPTPNPMEVKGLPTRDGPSDYQAHAQVGAISIGAEFMRHVVPTPQGDFSNEDYVTVEVGFFGPPGSKVKISMEDFSLRVNGKKAVPGQLYGVVLADLKDPSWEPPEAPKPKGGSISAGGDSGGGQPGDPPPAPPHMPMPLVHIMDQKVQKAAMPEGERTLPEAGLIFFSCRNQSDKIKSVELIYSGPAGKAVLTLQP